MSHSIVVAPTQNPSRPPVQPTANGHSVETPETQTGVKPEQRGAWVIPFAWQHRADVGPDWFCCGLLLRTSQRLANSKIRSFDRNSRTGRQ